MDNEDTEGFNPVQLSLYTVLADTIHSLSYVSHFELQ